jgi:hypothetical protein
MMNSGSPAFKSSHVSTHTNIWSEFPRSDRSSAMRPLQINDPDSLWDFGSFRPRPDQQSLDLLLNQRSRSPSGLRCFHPLLSYGVLRTRSSRFGTTRPLSDQRPRFTLVVSPPPCPQTSELWILHHLSSLTMDGPKSLRDFDKSTSLVHTRVKSRALTSRSNGYWSFTLRPNRWDPFLSSVLPLFCWTLI